ncbi:MAG: hypothetical protein WA635_11815 [Gallionella sp.]
MSKQLFLSMAMLTAATMFLVTAWIGDDAFITLRVIDNFINGYGLRYNVIERVQVFTHPLWLIFLTPFYTLTQEAMVTSMVISVILSLAAMWLLATRIAITIEYGCLLVLVAVASVAISQYSTSGLENPLTFLLLALFVWQLYRISEAEWIPAGIAGLLALNRLDLALLVGPVVAYLLFRTHGKDRAKVTVAAFLPAFAWMVFSLIYYGAPFPNTAYAKLGSGYSSDTLILRGLNYTKIFVLTDPLLALLIGKVVFDALRNRNWATKLLGVGIALYILYIAVIGGDFMSGRFFASPGFLAICLLARTPVPQWVAKQTNLIFLVSIGILVALLVMRATVQQNHSIPSNGITDERVFYADNGLFPVLTKWINTGVEPVQELGQRGMALKDEAQRTGTLIYTVQMNMGMIGYYSGPYVHNIDILALTDAFLARLPAIPGGRIGHYQRVLPSGYAKTVLYSVPTTQVEGLRPLLNDVTLATRSPLLSEGRWDAIWRLNSGHYSWAYETDILEQPK